MKLTSIVTLEKTRLEKENLSITSYLSTLPEGEIRL